MQLSTHHLTLAPDAFIDLQTHTVYSDGRWTPEALIEHLVSEKFGLAAITDHDRVDTTASLQRIAIEKKMPLLVSVEMTTIWRGELTDVLCYGFDPEKNALDTLAQDVQRRQQENTKTIFEDLRRKGYTFENETQVDEEAIILGKPAAQQPHEIVALMKRYGYGTGEKSAGQIITEAGFFFATTDIAAVVDAGHQSGAVCLIAHPGRSDGFICYDTALLDELRREVPIDGFEVYYPAHTAEQTAMYREYAQKHNLFTSSGSDSHGPDKKPIPYGAELSRSLLERLGIRVK